MAQDAIYRLYVESGPRRRKTMVHVLDLLGCIAQGPTTEDAFEATPAAIRVYLRFLREHGEAADAEAPFTTEVVEHVMEGPWLANGDPAPGFAPDSQPLPVDELAIYLRRLAWLRASLLQLVDGLSEGQLLAEPKAGGRPLVRILQHVGGAHFAYLHTTVGRVEGLNDALKALERGADGIDAALTRLWQISDARLESMTDTERTQQVQHGQKTWTARRALRRMLEHHWEHLLEITRRLGQPLD